jgi:hypothetical protein
VVLKNCYERELGDWNFRAWTPNVRCSRIMHVALLIIWDTHVI